MNRDALTPKLKFLCYCSYKLLNLANLDRNLYLLKLWGNEINVTLKAV